MKPTLRFPKKPTGRRKRYPPVRPWRKHIPNGNFKIALFGDMHRLERRAAKMLKEVALKNGIFTGPMFAGGLGDMIDDYPIRGTKTGRYKASEPNVSEGT